MWADEGTYRMAGAKSWVVTGKFGTGTWQQVWKPGEAGPNAASGSNGCRLATMADVARVLSSPAEAKEENPNNDTVGCRYRALFSSLDDLRIGLRQNAGNFFQNVRKGEERHARDVPGVGDQAYAIVRPGGTLVLELLKGTHWVKLELRLQPAASLDDTPYLAELGRVIAARL
jgi:hypothetical protein